jgi:hypothetical protein
MIQLNDLKNGYLYKIDARNANYGIWVEDRVSFVISRTKLGNNFLFEEEYKDGSAFGTALPLEEIEQSPFSDDDMPGFMNYEREEELLNYLNNQPGAEGRV